MMRCGQAWGAVTDAIHCQACGLHHEQTALNAVPNCLFRAPSSEPQVAGFRRAPVQTKGTETGDLIPNGQAWGAVTNAVHCQEQLCFAHCDTLLGVGSVDPAPYTLNPTPSTLHPQSYTLNPTPSTLHPQPYTLDPTPQPSTLNRHTKTLNPKNSTLNPKL